MLAADAQRGAAGRQHLQRGRGGEEAGHLRRGFDHVLAVVEEQQQLAGAEQRAQAGGERSVASLAEAERLGDRREDEGGIAERREVDERRPVGEGGRGVVGDRQSQPCLADTAGPGQRQEGNGLIEQQGARSR